MSNAFMRTLATLKLTDSTVSKNYEEKEKLQSSLNKSSALYLNTLKLNDEVEEETKAHWKKNDSLDTINNSTLSLHIITYKNSREWVESGLLTDKNDKKLKKEETIENTAHLFTSLTFFIQNPFEFSRQQNDKVVEPELSHFKAFQRLLNPNTASNMDQLSQKSTTSYIANTVESFLGRFRKFFKSKKSKKRKLPSFIEVDVDPKKYWNILEDIGEGAFGAVKKVSKIDNPKLIAAYKCTEIEDGEDVEDFAIEVEILHFCKSEHVVGIFAAYFHNN
uniref:Protein kinase domain-containing protein n=1 Tax=Panagrolaimus sp. PS1159 TaxID=55785 RepID=A0AC35GDN0_9BILA